MTSSAIINYGRHFVDDDDIASVIQVLQGDLITQGPVVEEFEKAIAKSVGAKHAVAVNSATAGLHLAAKVAGLGPRDKHLTSPLTFVASANAALYNQAAPIFADIDPETLGLEVSSVDAILHDAPDVRTVMPVHFAGLAANMAEIRKVSKGKVVIEDAAHALGAQYECGEPVGSGKYSDLCVFSFHPVKPVTTGEGGVITTNDDEWDARLRVLRSHGITKNPTLMKAVPTAELAPWYYEQVDLGFNFRMPDILAALGLSQIKKLEKFIDRRREIARRYDDAFMNLDFVKICQDTKLFRDMSGLHLYTALFDLNKLGMTRTEVISYLLAHNVGSQVHYIPLYRQPYYNSYVGPDIEKHFSNAENHYKRCLSLPVYPAMTDDDIQTVIRAVCSLSGKCS